MKGTGNWLVPGSGQGKSALKVLKRKEMLTKQPRDGTCQMLKELRADLKELPWEQLEQ